MDHHHLFGFESDFVERLQCIPMAVRFKLDRCGIKLTLKQWNQFTPADRTERLMAPCDSDGAVAAYAERLAELVIARSGGTARPVPEPVAMSQCVSAPTPEQWQALSDLERFVLVKLSRDNHDNVNFVPALREFGLLSEHWHPVA